MIDQQTIIFIVIGSVMAMLLLGGGIIGATYLIRPKVLLRQRMNQIGVIGDGEFEAPLGEEFRLLVEGQNLGMTIDDLMAKGIERLPTAEYKFFAIVTQIQRQTGGNLADTLAGLSTVLRERKKMRDKAQAMAAEAKASSMIIGSLPFAVAALLSVVNSDYLMLLFITDKGNYMLAGGAFWMSLGTLVMSKMINFEM